MFADMIVFPVGKVQRISAGFFVGEIAGILGLAFMRRKKRTSPPVLKHAL
tara:strand:- start:389 stop:538 length:150 start_codon:yes stop_codon:yes gene_type:complete